MDTTPYTEPHAALHAEPDTGSSPAHDAPEPSAGRQAGFGEQLQNMPIALRSERVYRELRRRVLMGLFNARDRLVEEKIATLLSVSRTPIREALVRLHADRLVDRYADGGYYVAVPDLAGLRDLYELRITLELRGLTRALEEPTYRHQTSVLEPLRDRWRRLRYDAPAPDAAFVEVDESFHVALSRSSGNHAITDMLETVNARIRPVRMHDFLTEDRIRLTIDQHLEIVEPVLIGEIDTAVQRLHRHVGESMEVVERRAARALTQMALRGRVPS